MKRVSQMGKMGIHLNREILVDQEWQHPGFALKPSLKGVRIHV
ncbi:MAG: hypothetical protein VKK04_04030 [Synechococcales bacterium]|nr:hypothetical protein [Synechococcales bacterium]